MTSLTFQQGDATWQKYRARALTDLFWLTDVVLGYGSLIPLTIQTHRLMLKFAERKTGAPLLDDAHYRLTSVPRGVGKTAGITIGKSIQDSLRDPEGSTMITNEVHDTANAFLGEIEGHFENNTFLRALFPDIIPAEPKRQDPWSATEMNLIRSTSRKEPTIFTIGAGGTRTGWHPDRIVGDDVISREAMENARAGSWQIVEKTNRWINQLVPLINYSAPWWEIHFIGTRWFVGDSYEYIERAFGYGETPQKVRLKQVLEDGTTQVLDNVYRIGDLAVFKRAIIENGASMFPEKFTLEDLGKIRQRDPELYAANYLNEPATDLTATFKQTWLRYFQWATPEVVRCLTAEGRELTAHLRDLDCLISVDPAFSEGTGHKSRQALVVTGSMEEVHFLLEAAATNQNVEAFIGDIVDAVRKFRPRKLLIERAGQQIAFIMLVKERLNEAGLPVAVEEVTPSGRKKEMRIQVLEPYFQRSTLYLDRTQHDFLNEYTAFPRGEHMDLLDALAYQAPFWRAGITTVRTGVHDRRAQEEVRRLYERMGVPAPPMTPSRHRDVDYREDGSARQ